jgi:hypothetical protein
MPTAGIARTRAQTRAPDQNLSHAPICPPTARRRLSARVLAAEATIARSLCGRSLRDRYRTVNIFRLLLGDFQNVGMETL